MEEAIVVKIEIELELAEIYRVFDERGIARNRANLQRFVRELRKADVKIPVASDFYDSFPTDRIWLLLAGFSFTPGGVR